MGFVRRRGWQFEIQVSGRWVCRQCGGDEGEGRALTVKGFFSFAAEKAGGREGYWNREIDETDRKSPSELQSLRHLVCRLLLEKKKIPHDSLPDDSHSVVAKPRSFAGNEWRTAVARGGNVGAARAPRGIRVTGGPPIQGPFPAAKESG